MSSRDIIRSWWHQRIGARESSSARALAARLNRGDAIDCLAESAVYDLGKALHLLHQPEQLLPLVRVLAAVREDRGGSLARRLGGVLSPARFEGLIRAEGDDLAERIRRALPMVDRACNVGLLGADLLDWSDKTRNRWVIDYHGGMEPESTAATTVSEQENSDGETIS
ncbi:hypothetical protein CN97_18855 [Haematobacter massiliensis]|uniref:Uncharacterized protein n=1 Tax=Haematobacter massiliensis TaxID=195105 RepID=A0A086Y2D3_9RHOB|nr:type I-E CRISPR-associated protein Cse2/CasB [Haematobacter massiliensis]KFI28433.1 hypothetical protein CN97_18855 [Haematobacter massiliensis]OWJ84723.1 hypothetical protein CDV51_13695 [Haematobacter massiliensis]QBJ26312.1 hypothetical protein HmaOT1_18360 [Haematobacter massiliensis]